jgi:hypothetical protein
MKFSKFGRIALASVVTLGLGFGVTACGPPNTIDFIYVTSSNKNNPGQVNAYKLDSQAGALLPIPNSPYSSGGQNPVADAASANGKNLYVVNHDSNAVVVFAISTDGSLSQQQSCGIPGTFPTQLAINSRASAPTNPDPGRWWSFPSMPTGNWGPREVCVSQSRMAPMPSSRWEIIR